MRINTNVAALNSYNQLKNTQNNLSKSLSRLSSGKRINGAADDAAGLAISEKMNSQTRGLAQAQRNAQDGISMIQTAEGALKESHSILQRMRELSVQSANDTNTDADRAEIQNEVSQLKEELDRIGNTTEFNTQKLLNGNLAGAGGTNDVNTLSGAQVFKQTSGSLTGVDASGVDATTLAETKDDALLIDGNKITIDWDKHLSQTDIDTLEADYSTVAMDAEASANVRDILQKGINSAIDASGTGVEHVEVTDSTAGTFEISSGSKGNDSTVELYRGTDANATAKLADGSTAAVGSNSVLDIFAGAKAELVGNTTEASGTNEILDGATGDINISIGDHTLPSITPVFTSGTDANTAAASLETSINDEIDTYNTGRGLAGDDKVEHVSVNVEDGRLNISSPSGPVSISDTTANTDSVESLGLDKESRSASGGGSMSFQIGANAGQAMSISIGDMRSSALGLSGIDLSTQAGAETALNKLDDAISEVSSQRSSLGAVQNRLDHTINNLSTAEENLTAAESRISDVDMAKEMMNMSKQQILSQAGTAMLAQANQLPQGVLQLLG